MSDDYTETLTECANILTESTGASPRDSCTSQASVLDSVASTMQVVAQSIGTMSTMAALQKSAEAVEWAESASKNASQVHTSRLFAQTDASPPNPLVHITCHKEWIEVASNVSKWHNQLLKLTHDIDILTVIAGDVSMAIQAANAAEGHQQKAIESTMKAIDDAKNETDMHAKLHQIVADVQNVQDVQATTPNRIMATATKICRMEVCRVGVSSCCLM